MARIEWYDANLGVTGVGANWMYVDETQAGRGHWTSVGDEESCSCMTSARSENMRQFTRVAG